MNKCADNVLTPSQFAITLTSTMLGVGLLSLPNDVVKVAKQDGWISCIIGMAYPLYMIFLGKHMCKKFPKENILILSKKCLGKVLGTILNFVFVMFFFLLATAAASGIGNVLLVYMVSFLKRYKILTIIFLSAVFIAYKGIASLGRVNERIFYIALPIIFIPISTLNQGSILNIMPVFSSGVMNILKASKETVFAYAGIEILFLIYPFLQDNKKFLKCSIFAVVFTGFIYAWLTFSTIFYLGIETIPKFLWSLVTITESIIIPIINSFRYIFMVLWSLVMMRTISNSYFGFVYGLSQITKYISIKKYAFIMYPLVCYASIKYGNTIMRANIMNKIVPIYVLFNLIYVSLVAFLMTIKKGDKYEQKV